MEGGREMKIKYEKEIEDCSELIAAKVGGGK